MVQTSLVTSVSLLFLLTLEAHATDLLVFVSVKPECEGDPLQRLLNAAKYNKVEIRVLSDRRTQNYKALNAALEPYKNSTEQIVLYLASPEDALLIADSEAIVTKFKTTEKRVVFAGDTECEPDPSLSANFPEVNGTTPRFLSSAGICGYADSLYALTTADDNEVEDQLYYMTKFIEDSRGNKNFGIDYYSEIFYTWSEMNDPLDLTFNEKKGVYEAVHELTKVQPCILISKGVLSVDVNRYNDYLNGGRSLSACLRCEAIELPQDEYPNVTIAVYTFLKTSFLVEFLQKLADQDYPKEKLSLFLYNCIPEHDEAFVQFKNEFKEDYKEIHYIYTAYACDKFQLFERGIAAAKASATDFLFVLESFAHLDNKSALKLLLETRGDRKVIGPLLKRPDESWTNFWGTLDIEKGFYERSFDYLDIVSNTNRGIYCVPFIMNAYLIHSSVFPEISYQFIGNWYNLGLDFINEVDVVFCNNLRKRNIYLYVNNLHDFGHLVRAEGNEPALLPPTPVQFLEFYQMAKNRIDWQKEYIHDDFWKYLSGELAPEEVCPDVFRFRVVTDRFCNDLVDIMENYGQWSPLTNDIHMSQVGLHDEWLYFMSNNIQLLQKKVFQYYESDPPKPVSQMVVRHQPNEVSELKPLNDASAYKFSIALNSYETDYQGGGVQFMRYNCSITDTKKGYLVMHPGGFTHHYEDLKVTNGTRYVAVTVVDR